MNCILENSQPSDLAKVRANTVLPTPGTSSIRRWPPDNRVIRESFNSISLPKTTVRILSKIVRAVSTSKLVLFSISSSLLSKELLTHEQVRSPLNGIDRHTK